MRRPFLAALLLAVVALGIVFVVRGNTLRVREREPRTMEQLLPWHKPRLDRDGKLLPWADADPGRGYERMLQLAWRRLARLRQAPGVAPYLRWATFDPKTGDGGYWQGQPAFLVGSFAESAARWYAFSGDRRPVRLVRELLDYDLRHGLTKRSWAWPRVPYSSSCGGAADYGGCPSDRGAPASTIQPDKVGEAGLGFLRFWELTGDPAYRAAAVQAGAVLARHVRRGDALHSPWPFRLDARTGTTVARAWYGAGYAPTLTLLDKLVQDGLGPRAELQRARTLLLDWFLQHPLNPRDAAYDKWSRYAEDVAAWPLNVNQITALYMADYLLQHRQAADRRWLQHAQHLVAWTKATFLRGPFYGATAIDEQAKGFSCCSRAGLGNHTARWAAVATELAAATADNRLAKEAERSLSYATYFSDSKGNVACCGIDNPSWWFSTGYSELPRLFLAAMGARPALAPSGERHLVWSSSTVRQIRYGARSISYRVFARRGREILRLDRRPQAVRGGRWSARPIGRGDVLVDISHSQPKVLISF